MHQIARTIERIEKATTSPGSLPELAREAGIPYTTVVDWKARGWRPKAIKTLEALSDAADTILARTDDQGAAA